MNAVCPECDTEYHMRQERLDLIGCMYCSWDGAKEERPGHPRQEIHQTAHTETPIERNSVMSDSTAPEVWGYTTERYNPDTYEYDADQNTLKRQDSLRVDHHSGDPEQYQWYADFHLYRHFINGEEVIGKTLIAVEAETGQQIAHLQMSKGHFAELAIWLTEQFSKDVEWRREYNAAKARHQEEQRRRLIRDHNTVDAQVRAQEGEPA